MQTLDKITAIWPRVQGPCLLNLVPGGKTPLDDVRVAESMGYRVTILPGALMVPAIDAVDEALKVLRETGRAAARAAASGRSSGASVPTSGMRSGCV